MEIEARSLKKISGAEVCTELFKKTDCEDNEIAP